MSVKIRLAKTGKKHQISYRLVATDTRAKRDSKFVEILGFYYPHGPEAKLEIKEDRLDYWISKGAKPTIAVDKLIKLNHKPTQEAFSPKND